MRQSKLSVELQRMALHLLLELEGDGGRRAPQGEILLVDFLHSANSAGCGVGVGTNTQVRIKFITLAIDCWKISLEHVDGVIDRFIRLFWICETEKAILGTVMKLNRAGAAVFWLVKDAPVVSRAAKRADHYREVGPQDDPKLL